MAITAASPLRFYFVSSNLGWGGSEELWSAAAARLLDGGHEVTAFKCDLEGGAPVRQLHERGCTIKGQVWRTPLNALSPRLGKLAQLLLHVIQPLRLYLSLRVASRPDLIVLSQGGNFDGCALARTFLSLPTPYVVIAHKATDLYWPADDKREGIRSMYAGALACYFVSQDTQRLTEEQLGVTLPHARVVRNPYLVPWTPRSDWPDDRAGLRLACVGRLNIMEKGQDILLRVMAREKWRNRPVSITFYGDGSNRDGLVELADYLQLKSVSFAGFVNDIDHIWRDNHGLVLPSRCEGLPIVLIEAMLSGRVPIVTDVAGNREVIKDGSTGFIAAAATEDALDDAMERAWVLREQWPALGAAASAHIRTLVSPDPAADMASLLRDLASCNAEAHHPHK